jgi:thiamine-phosphate pyrophosphorylase
MTEVPSWGSVPEKNNLDALILQRGVNMRFVNICKVEAEADSGNDWNGTQRAVSLLLYAITNRCQLAESEADRAQKLVDLAARWAANKIDFIQIREKDLSSSELFHLTSEIVRAVRQASPWTRILLNTDIRSIAAEVNLEAAVSLVHQARADGVHLPGGLSRNQLTAAIRQLQQELGQSAPISVSCHTTTDAIAARNAGATLALFAPVFEKVLPGIGASQGTGIDALEAACRAAAPSGEPPLPILALGGVTLENAAECVAAGAAGIAAIRLFAENPELKFAASAANVLRK